MASPLGPAADGVRLYLRVTPRGGRDAVAGVMEGPGGRRMVKLSVTAAPEDGKANAAVVALLAKTWRLPKTSLAIVAGGADRSKVLFIAGDPAALMGILGPWAEGLPRLT